VLDVHPPHEALHGWRDFLIHLFTITVGLLIALSLEGVVEWQHHRHLVHDAEVSLHAEIKSNAEGMPGILADLKKRQDLLKQSVSVLKVVIKTHKLPDHSSIDIGFGIKTFQDVSWKTAQNTGALALMPYELAQEYSNIYATQDELATTEQQAARDAIISLGLFLNEEKGDPDLTPEQASALIDKIGVLQGQILLVGAFMNNLDGEYKEFLAEHPE